MSLRVQLQPALVLHRRPYRESSLLVELFTAEHGRVGAIGRGAKSRAGLLQPFQPLLASWSSRGELASLGAIERDQSEPLGLVGLRLTCGLYLNELLIKLTARNDPLPALFSAYKICLRKLVDDDDPDWLLRRFEVQLLAELGYGLVLDVQAETGSPLQATQLYCYQADHGAVPSDNGQTPWHVRGATLLALEHDAPPADGHVKREARGLLQAMIDHQLGGQALKTRELLKPIWK